MTIDLLPDNPRPRRVMAPERRYAREAVLLVRPINRKLGLWHAGSVKLATMAERLRAAGGSDAALRQEARGMLATIREQAGHLEAQLAGADPHIAGHGAVADTRRALAMIEERLRSALKSEDDPAR